MAKKKPKRRKPKPTKLPEGWKKCGCGMRIPPEKVCPICEHDKSLMRVAVVMDDWKLQTFTRILEENEYPFSQAEGITKKSRTIIVMTNDPQKLKTVIERCERTCAATKN